MVSVKNANSFHVVTYNILAKSLGTNTIPWVMTASPSIRKRIEDYASPQKFEEWVSSTLKPEYLAHFHKNFKSGDYATMRGFWGAKKCENPDDIPSKLRGGLTWVGEDQVSYENDEPSVAVATTMRGMAKKSLPPDLFRDFFQDIISAEEQVFAWQTRGPRIFATVIGNEKPDLVALQEYDCHDTVAGYREVGHPESFADAMVALGYDGAFFKDPLRGRDPPAGLGLFWLREVFQPEGAPVEGCCGMQVLECDEEILDGALFNKDLQEQWHPTSRSEETSPPELMRAADRRNAALARLRHLPTSKTVAFCCSHLMTTSRDGVKTNQYPGEVRAGEIAAVRSLIETRSSSPDDAVLLVGDLNTDAKSCESVLGGTIAHADPGNSSILEIDTGFDSNAGAFLWGVHQLSEAFVDVHRWGEDVGDGKNCTSRNAERVEWIDYIFHGANLRPIALSDCQTPDESMPDKKHASDHLPLRASFEFVEV